MPATNKYKPPWIPSFATMASKYSKCSQISISKCNVLFWNQESGPRADPESLAIIVLFFSLSSRIRKWSLGRPSSGKKGKHKWLRKKWERPRLVWGCLEFQQRGVWPRSTKMEMNSSLPPLSCFSVFYHWREQGHLFNPEPKWTLRPLRCSLSAALPHGWEK